MKNAKQLLFWIFSLSVVFGLTLPVLIQDAMFQDAMLYSSVSHNLSQGIGTFWFPQYSKLNIAGLSSFHEHPPLVFGVQSLFFKVLGSSIYVERFYTLLMIVLTVILINHLWKMLFLPSDGQRQLGWLAVLFWISIPVCFWSYRSNMMENTMAIFDLLAVIFFLHTVRSGKNKWLWLAASGLMIFLASFSKGVPGLFPLAAPFIYWIVWKENSFSGCVRQTLILTAVPILIYIILTLFPESRESLYNYVFKRLLMRVDVMPTADYRLEILWRLVKEMIPLIIMVAIVLIITGYRKAASGISDNLRKIIFFMLIGLSGSAPMTLTMVQKGWYLTPAFPYFAIGFAMIISPIISGWVERINPNKRGFAIFRLITLLLVLGVIIITASQYGNVSRERDTVADVYEIGKVVPRQSALTCEPDLYDEYNFILEGFLVRYFNISLDPNEHNDFYLKQKSSSAIVPDGYEPVDISLKKFELYRKR